jgi:hypothetical protein
MQSVAALAVALVLGRADSHRLIEERRAFQDLSRLRAQQLVGNVALTSPSDGGDNAEH